MKFSIKRETLLKPLQAIIGVVERRNTMPILANVKLEIKDQCLVMSATDLEIQMVAEVSAASVVEPGVITVPARKLVDIFRSLPDEAEVRFSLENQRMLVTAGKSRFVLASLPATDFPSMRCDDAHLTLSLPQSALIMVLKRTAFAMAQQDVRYFLNGLLLEVGENRLRAVATDGHRMAMTTLDVEAPGELKQVIVPRKAVLELMRLLEESEEPVSLALSKNMISATLPKFEFTSKLLDGRYPDYQRVIPEAGENVLVADCETLRQALSRTAILSNEKYRGVRLMLEDSVLKLSANNPEQEEAEDEIEVSYQGSPLEVGFNVSYLLDVLSVLEADQAEVLLAGNSKSALMREKGDAKSLYVVMPIRL